jgi:hypothetical protein
MSLKSKWNERPDGCLQTVWRDWDVLELWRRMLSALDADGNTPLHRAVASGNFALVRHILLLAWDAWFPIQIRLEAFRSDVLGASGDAFREWFADELNADGCVGEQSSFNVRLLLC